MPDTDEKRAALRVLAALEQGTQDLADVAVVMQDDLDPVLVHAIVSYLRAVYPASDPAASGVLQRLVDLTAAHPALIAKHDEGGRDPIIEWFEGDYEYRDFRLRGDELIDLLVEKLES